MKKIQLLFVVIIAIIAVYVFANKLYYPSLPITGVSPKEAIDRLSESDSKIVQIAEEGNNLWFMTKSESNGVHGTDETIKELVTAKGWVFKEKDGAGLFFEKNGETLIATTQMWTENYVLVQIPEF